MTDKYLSLNYPECFELRGGLLLFPDRLISNATGDRKVEGFYEQAGFVKLDNVRLLEGNPTRPKVHDEAVFMSFLSDKGKVGRNSFETKPVYFGEDVW